MNKHAPSPTQTWLSERQLADHFQISIRHLHNLRQAGLPHILLGSTVRYDHAEVEAFIRNKRRLTSHIERQQRRKTVAAK